MKAADTSAVVAAFASWHEHHERARALLDGGLALIEQCALESYSVLTRLPAPHRCPPRAIRTFLKERFPGAYLRLDPESFKEFLLHLPDNAIAGGAVYDALVAATAAQNRAELVTCDKRAAAIYEKYNVKAVFIG